jgi:hypothetical protein
MAEPKERPDLNLANPFTGDVKGLANFFERCTMLGVQTEPHLHHISFALGKFIKNDPHGFTHIFEFNPSARVDGIGVGNVVGNR